MLGNNYLEINGVKIPNPRGYEEGYSTIETVKTAEDGREISIMTRANKRTLDFEFKVTSTWKRTLLAFSARPFVTLRFKNETMDGRFRVAKTPLKEGSEHIEGTDGLWTLSAKFIER